MPDAQSGVPQIWRDWARESGASKKTGQGVGGEGEVRRTPPALVLRCGKETHGRQRGCGWWIRKRLCA